MQAVSSTFTQQSSSSNQSRSLAYGVLISWTKQSNENYSLFTIGVSSIGGPDFIPSGAVNFPSFWNQYQYTDYGTYAISTSVTRNLGQYTYGVFGAQGNAVLSNTTLLFYPGYDPTIGNYITYGRPISLAYGFQNPSTGYSETINLFYGTTTKPQNSIVNRSVTLPAYDGINYLQDFTSYANGPLAQALNGSYYQGQALITSASNNVSLPQSIINIDTTSGFLSSGNALIVSTNGYQTIDRKSVV